MTLGLALQLWLGLMPALWLTLGLGLGLWFWLMLRTGHRDRHVLNSTQLNEL